MSRWSRGLGAAILALAALVAAAEIDRGPHPPGPVVTRVAGSACRPAPPTSSNGRVLPEPSVTFGTNDAVRFRICRPSTLELDATGTQAGGVYARLVVSDGATQLTSLQVEGERRLSVSLPHAGWVLVAFVNDLSTGTQDRNLRLADLIVKPPLSSTTR